MPAIASSLTVLDLGCIEYEPALLFQKELAARRAADAIGDTLLLLEHPHTYTLGTRGTRKHLLVPEEQLRSEGIAVLDVDRGGDVTYHGPGQLVGYPIIRLDGIRSVVTYVRRLEEVCIRVAADFGVEGRLPQLRKPPWLKTTARQGENYRDLKHLMGDLALNTVCQQAACPNIYECWEDREATFLIGGDLCTRRCGFCQIDTGKPAEYDTDEPRRVAESVATMQLRYA